MGSYRYDFFKAELLKTPYFDDNIMCHFTASFAAVRLPFLLLFVVAPLEISNHEFVV